MWYHHAVNYRFCTGDFLLSVSLLGAGWYSLFSSWYELYFDSFVAST